MRPQLLFITRSIRRPSAHPMVGAVLVASALLLTACAAEDPVVEGAATGAATPLAEQATEDAVDAMTGMDDPAPSTSPAQALPTSNLTDGCAEGDVDGDWFPDKVAFDHADGITVDYDGNVKTVTIAQPNDAATEPFVVAMVQCGTTPPADLDADAVVEVPVDAVVTYSTTFLPSFDLIDRVDALVAHGGLGFASTPSVLDAAAAGEIVEVGDQTAPDLEALAAAEPDVVVVSAGFSGADPTEPFAALPDLPVIPNASFLDADPLGRAEWMKLEAMLLNEEAAVTAVFDGIESDFQSLADLAAGVTDRPLVLTNAPFEGTWFASGGDSYTARLVDLAGGTYVFADEPGTTLALDLESVLAAGQDADVWLSAGSVTTTPEAFLTADERLGEFAAFPDQVWANDADLGPSGGNRFFEDGAARPDLVLADTLAILHPDLLPDHELQFFGLLGSAAGSDAEAGAGG